MGLAVAVGLLVPGCVGLNAAFEDGQDAGEGSGAGTSMSTGGAAPTGSGSTLLTASASGVTGSSTLTMTTMGVSPDVGSSSDSDVAPEGWWHAAYGHRRQLVFQPRDEPLLDFVTYVPLSFDPPELEGVTASQLAFVDADLGTRIPAEIVRFDLENGEVIAWVQIPTWKSGEATSVFLYFGADAPQLPSVTPWTGHVAVWHMDEFAALTTPDATGAADAISVGPAGASITVVDGVVGGALALDGEAHRLEAILSPSPAADTFLVSGWVHAQSYTNLPSPIIARGDSTGPSWLDTEWFLGLDSVRAAARLHDDQSEVSPRLDMGVVSPASAAWHHYAFLFTGTSVRLFIDGTERVAGGTAPGTQHVLDVVSIGGFSGLDTDGWQDRLLNGWIDELRWRQGADDDAPTNAAWVATLYESQLDPGATFGAGPVEDL